jgi:uncharacterized lipoprotein YddW (UPF0748 family)
MNQINKEEIRGVWISSHFSSPVLTSKKTIIDALNFLADHKFNYVFPAVWNQGYTAFPSDVMVNNGFPRQDIFYKGEFDPLATIITEGEKRNIKVIPWLEYGFAVSPNPDGGFILKGKPKWSALDSEGKKVQHGGLTWMNSLDPEVQTFMQKLVLELVEKYPGIAGIQGDDRFPAMPFLGGYDTKTKENYKKEFKKDLPKYFKDRKDDEWKNWVDFRAKELTNYLEGLSKKVKEKNPHLIVSMAPSPYPYGLKELMQDSDVWVEKKIVDFLHPQIYRYSVDKYKAEVKKIIEKVKKEDHKKYVPGIAFRVRNEQERYINLTPTEIVKCVEYNREQGLGGQVFFDYDYLRENDDAIANALSDFWGKNS